MSGSELERDHKERETRIRLLTNLRDKEREPIRKKAITAMLTHISNKTDSDEVWAVLKRLDLNLYNEVLKRELGFESK